MVAKSNLYIDQKYLLLYWTFLLNVALWVYLTRKGSFFNKFYSP